MSPASTVEPSQAPPEVKAIAPAWHTACVLLFMLAMVTLTKLWLTGGHIEQAHSRLPGYILTMFM